MKVLIKSARNDYLSQGWPTWISKASVSLIKGCFLLLLELFSCLECSVMIDLQLERAQKMDLAVSSA